MRCSCRCINRKLMLSSRVDVAFLNSHHKLISRDGTIEKPLHCAHAITHAVSASNPETSWKWKSWIWWAWQPFVRSTQHSKQLANDRLAEYAAHFAIIEMKCFSICSSQLLLLSDKRERGVDLQFCRNVTVFPLLVSGSLHAWAVHILQTGNDHNSPIDFYSISIHNTQTRIR